MNNLSIDIIKNLYWEQKLTVEEVAKKLDISVWLLYNFMNENKLCRRNPSEANFVANRFKPQFKIKEKLSYEEENLKTAGIMLYWAEGAKGKKAKTVDFSNSDPDMIKIFLKFLRNICGVSEKRLRVYLYTYSGLHLKKLIDYWVRVTGIPREQFLKPYIRENNPNYSGRKLPFGLVHIRYSDKRLLEMLLSWIERYKHNILNVWTGTQVAKGGRLFKSSVW